MMRTKAWVALAMCIGLFVGAHLCANIPALAQLARYSTMTKIRCDTLRVTGAIISAGTDSVAGACTIDGALTVGGALGVTGTITGDVTGDVTGNLKGDAANSVAAVGNLPAAASHTGEFYRNTTGDSLWYADNDSWVLMVP